MGREPNCDLRAASRAVSLRHCELFDDNGHICVRDLASTNGTFINDQRINGPAELVDGDLLRLGPLAFRLSIQVEIPVDVPTPLPGQRPVAMPTEEEAAALLFELDAQEGPREDLGGTQ